MAYCPKCKGEMLPTAIECTHCGYDFPSRNSDGRGSQSGFAYSPLADLALIVSMIAASIGACAAAQLQLWLACIMGNSSMAWWSIRSHACCRSVCSWFFYACSNKWKEVWNFPPFTTRAQSRLAPAISPHVHGTDVRLIG